MKIHISTSKAEKDIIKGDRYIINTGTPKKPILYVGEVLKVSGSKVTFRYNGTESRSKRIELGKGTAKIVEKTKRKRSHKPLSDKMVEKILGTPPDKSNATTTVTVKANKLILTKATLEKMTKAQLRKHSKDVLTARVKELSNGPTRKAELLGKHLDIVTALIKQGRTVSGAELIPVSKIEKMNKAQLVVYKKELATAHRQEPDARKKMRIERHLMSVTRALSNINIKPISLVAPVLKATHGDLKTYLEKKGMYTTAMFKKLCKIRPGHIISITNRSAGSTAGFFPFPSSAKKVKMLTETIDRLGFFGLMKSVGGGVKGKRGPVIERQRGVALSRIDGSPTEGTGNIIINGFKSPQGWASHYTRKYKVPLTLMSNDINAGSELLHVTYINSRPIK